MLLYFSLRTYSVRLGQSIEGRSLQTITALFLIALALCNRRRDNELVSEVSSPLNSADSRTQGVIMSWGTTRHTTIGDAVDAYIVLDNEVKASGTTSETSSFPVRRVIQIFSLQSHRQQSNTPSGIESWERVLT